MMMATLPKAQQEVDAEKPQQRAEAQELQQRAKAQETQQRADALETQSHSLWHTMKVEATKRPQNELERPRRYFALAKPGL